RYPIYGHLRHRGDRRAQWDQAKVEFDDSRLSSDNVLVEALGIQWKVKINLVNYNDPILDIYAGCETVLSAFQRGLEEKFGMDLGVVLAGKGEIDCAIQIRSDHPPKLNGYIRAQDAMIRLGGGNMLLEHVKGEAHFTPNNLKWSGVDLTCGGKVYKSSGELTNFKSPGIQLDVSSKEMSFESVLAIAGKTLNFSKLDGKYLNSYFSVTGSVDTGDPGALPAKIKGVLDIDLKDLNGIAALREFQDKAKAEGRVNAEFSTDGDIKDIKGCKIETGVKSAYLSLYGLKLERPTMNYFQEKGLGQIRALRSSFYGGSLWAAAKVDWNRKDLPYSANFDIKEVRLELLKKDMGFKDKDVSGDIKIYCGINGSLKDASAVGGAGKISIAKGKLWQLDLFKGLGMLIFTSDFSDIVFADGSCNFRIEDEAFTTNDLILRSGLLDLSGAGRIGFDKSIKAALKSELAEEAMYPGAKMNLAVAIGKYTYIDVVGTLEEPMFKIRPSFSDMAEDIKNVFRGE
ncbi:MAG: hypothetical protein PHT32_08185, partial [Candidatus Omnitrophica bacterium]|nr:hypothetical protein [Candidatus Omnitrophota bacterium]